MQPRWRALLAASCLLAAPARAQDAGGDGEDGPQASWTIGFFGGILSPIGRATESRESGLVASARVSWTSRIGLGLTAGVDYSPLPRVMPPNLTAIESHLLVAIAAPRLTLGRDTFRAWIAAGGGGIYERTTTEDAARRRASDNRFAPAASAALGLEMYFFSSGGLTLAATGLQSFGGDELRLYALTGGLVFVFH